MIFSAMTLCGAEVSVEPRLCVRLLQISLLLGLSLVLDGDLNSICARAGDFQGERLDVLALQLARQLPGVAGDADVEIGVLAAHATLINRLDAARDRC